MALDVGVAALGEAAAPGGTGVVDEQVEAASCSASRCARTCSGALSSVRSTAR